MHASIVKSRCYCNIEGGQEDESSVSAHKVSASYSNLCNSSFFRLEFMRGSTLCINIQITVV